LPQEPKLVDRRSRKVYVLWGVALALLLAAGLFCWLVVLPVLEVRRVRAALKPVRAPIIICFVESDSADQGSTLSREEVGPIIRHLPAPSFSRDEAAPIIQQLGGPGRAAHKLGLFLRLPPWLTGADISPNPPLASLYDDYGLRAAHLLCYCAEPAVPELLLLLDHRDKGVRQWVMFGFATIRPKDPEVATALEEELRDEDKDIRQAAAEALKRIRAAEKKEDPPQ